jgi:hypothetical protein
MVPVINFTKYIPALIKKLTAGMPKESTGGTFLVEEKNGVNKW